MQTVTLAELLTLHSLGYATDRWGTPTRPRRTATGTLSCASPAIPA